MAKRESKKVVAGVTAEMFQDALSNYAINDAIACKKTAAMELGIAKVREKYNADLQMIGEKKAAMMEVIQSYCTANKELLFAKQRHVDTAHGKVGFRLGTPKLKTLPKWTWEKVLAAIKTVLPDYVRKIEEVNKEDILMNRANADVAPHLVECGLYVVQEESFYIELKKEEGV